MNAEAALRIEGKDLAKALLPEGVEVLSLHTVHRSHLPALSRLQGLNLRHLELRWYSAPDLSDFPFPPTLVGLHVWHSSKLRSLAGLERATGLEELVLEDNGLLEDAAALASLPALRSLSVLGGMNGKQKLSDLAFLDGLSLERLTLRGVQGVSKDLEPVVRLKTLTFVDLFGPDFEPAELAMAAAAHSDLYARLIDIEDESSWANCKSCGGPRKCLFLRRRKGLWCPVCERDGWTRALDEFRDMVDAARASQNKKD